MKAPEITSHLRDAQIDEGNRFEFTAYIKGEPVPEIRWFKVCSVLFSFITFSVLVNYVKQLHFKCHIWRI